MVDVLVLNWVCKFGGRWDFNGGRGFLGTEKDAAAVKRAVTEWHVTNHRGPQQMDLLHQCQALGMDRDDAATLRTLRRLTAADKAAGKPWKSGLLTFAAFILLGSVLSLSLVILIPFTEDKSAKFLGACSLSVLALAFLGIAKARIAGQNYAFPVCMTPFNRAVAAAAAYFMRWALRNLGGL